MRFHLAIVFLALATATPGPSLSDALDAREGGGGAPERRYVPARERAKVRDNVELAERAERDLAERDPDDRCPEWLFSRSEEFVYSRAAARAEGSFIARCPAKNGKPARSTAPQKKSRPPATEPDGCGPPGCWNDKVPELIFNPCCNDHDICYTTCSRSKWDCDQAFKKCVHDRCRTVVKWWVPNVRVACDALGEMYYMSFRTRMANEGFEGASKWYCNCG